MSSRRRSPFNANNADLSYGDSQLNCTFLATVILSGEIMPPRYWIEVAHSLGLRPQSNAKFYLRDGTAKNRILAHCSEQMQPSDSPSSRKKITKRSPPKPDKQKEGRHQSNTNTTVRQLNLSLS